MNKTELVSALADKLNVSKRLAGDMVNGFIEIVIDGVAKHGEVKLTPLGNFSIRHSKARKGRNPRTGEEIQIKASKSPKFRPGKMFREAVK